MTEAPSATNADLLQTAVAVTPKTTPSQFFLCYQHAGRRTELEHMSTQVGKDMGTTSSLHYNRGCFLFLLTGALPCGCS